jgi:hypothetical protein
MTSTSFAAFAFGPADSFSTAPATHRVNSVSGTIQEDGSLPAPGWSLARIDTEMHVEQGQPIVFYGKTKPLQYTCPAQVASLAHAHGEFASGASAVVIPIRKSEAWWALSEEQRHVHFREGAGHTHTGAPYVDRIYRKLFHSREMGLPYDFVTYFEFAPEDADYFRELLAGLRDPIKNPEWQFVEWECEIWTTKL